MRTLMRTPLFLVLLAATGACQADGFGAGTYTGTVSARTTALDGASQVHRGRGEARFSTNGLRVVGAIADPRGDAGFEVSGRPGGGGWQGAKGGLQFRIAPDGSISGGGVDGPQKIRFSGRASGAAMRLVADVELMERNRSGTPAGTRVVFTYDLERTGGGSAVATRTDSSAGSSRSRSDIPRDRERRSGKDCDKPRYVNRPRADVGSGSLIMTRVAVCD